jgi:hypothetical protein
MPMHSAQYYHPRRTAARFQDLTKHAINYPDKDLLATPNIGQFVFCQVLEDLGSIEVDDHEG